MVLPALIAATVAVAAVAAIWWPTDSACTCAALASTAICEETPMAASSDPLASAAMVLPALMPPSSTEAPVALACCTALRAVTVAALASAAMRLATTW